ncbi:MAG: DegT/DnrJ/EryC1/StrS family aminotransferase [Acidobacteria bacterium]|nr:DegT/DnrJ/EryC1/StrS family aminotransferase [Acidobacteriota bacterium]
MLRFVPPAGAPVKLGHLVRALGSALFAGHDPAGALERIADTLHVSHVFGASSGRAALSALLTALHTLHPDRNLVAVPAYTCYSVAAAVARAGLQLQPVDIDPETLDYDFQALEAIADSGLLCALTSNLFGLPSDAERVARIAHSMDAFAVDDAAQAMGATRNGRPAGMVGDAGLFSLARGKALAAGGGGLVVTSDDRIADALRAQFLKLPRTSSACAPAVFLENLAITLLLHPRLYWMPNSLPMLKLGVTEFDPGFHMQSMSGFTSALLGHMIEELRDLNRCRIGNARRILSALPEGSGFRSPEPPVGASPIYLRLPLLASDGALRDRALARLKAAGIGASSYYPGAVCDIPGIEAFLAAPGVHFPRAESVARRIVTLPTHPLVEPKDLERMVEILVASSRESSSLPVCPEARAKTALAGRQ